MAGLVVAKFEEAGSFFFVLCVLTMESCSSHSERVGLQSHPPELPT